MRLSAAVGSPSRPIAHGRTRLSLTCIRSVATRSIGAEADAVQAAISGQAVRAISANAHRHRLYQATRCSSLSASAGQAIPRRPASPSRAAITFAARFRTISIGRCSMVDTSSGSALGFEGFTSGWQMVWCAGCGGMEGHART